MENSDHLLMPPSLHKLIGLQEKKNSASCSEFHLAQNDLDLRKMRFFANSSSSSTNVSISREFGNAAPKNKAILKLRSHILLLMSLLLSSHGYRSNCSMENQAFRNNTKN